MRAIKGWAHQFGHGGIDNHEVFGLALLGADDARDQNTGIGGNKSTRFQYDLAAAIGKIFGNQARIGRRVGRGFIIALIGHAQPAAQIKLRDGLAFGAQARQQVGGFFKCGSEGPKIGDLAADVNVDRARGKTRQPRSMGISGFGVFPRNAEFVFGFAG